MYCKVIPGYVKSFKRQYISLLGIDQEFGYLIKDLDFKDVERGSMKKRSGWIDKINNYIKKYKEALDSGIFKDLSEEELPIDVFLNIEHIEATINEYLERYLDFGPYEPIAGSIPDGVFKIDKQKYENNVDKDYPGLRKLIDTLDYYYATIKYKKIYNFPESETRGCTNIHYSDSDGDSDSDNDGDNDSDREYYFSKEELKKHLYFKEGLDSDINYSSDSDSDSVSDISFDSDIIFDSDSDSD